MNTCKRCHQEYALRDGDDPTHYCDECAHEVVKDLSRQISKLKESQSWMLKLLACAIAKYGEMTLDIPFYFGTGKVPTNPTILTHQNHGGETVVSLAKPRVDKRPELVK